MTTDRQVLVELAAAHDVPVRAEWNAGKIAMEIFGDVVEPTLLQPTFVCDYPEIAQPLARTHRTHEGLVEAWDLIIAGVERGTAFSELIDPEIQRARLVEQSLLAAGGDPEAMVLDEDFLEAMEQGMPPAGGMGMGIVAGRRAMGGPARMGDTDRAGERIGGQLPRQRLLRHAGHDAEDQRGGAVGRIRRRPRIRMRSK